MHGMGGRILQLSTPHLHSTGRILVSVSAHSPVADHPEGLPRKENKAKLWDGGGGKYFKPVPADSEMGA